MLDLKNRLNYEYNSKLDILYINLKDSDDTYGHEDNYGVVQNYDYNTKELVGFDIWDFKYKMSNSIEIKLTVPIDLKEIFESMH